MSQLYRKLVAKDGMEFESIRNDLQQLSNSHDYYAVQIDGSYPQTEHYPVICIPYYVDFQLGGSADNPKIQYRIRINWISVQDAVETKFKNDLEVILK